MTGLWFDEVADPYDRVRPRYPRQLFDDLAEIAAPPEHARVIEVGPGPGQATRDLLARGWHVHAVEPGAAMAARARDNFAGHPFSVDEGRFDDWDPDGRTFDLLFSATAYHWVAPEVRWARAAAVLEPGGHIALATNQTVAGGALADAMAATADLHHRHAPGVYHGPPEPVHAILDRIAAGPRDLGAVWHAVETKARPSSAGDLFGPPTLRWYEWETTYDATDARTLLSTYSQYLRLPPDRRDLLLDAVADTVRTDFGGEVTQRYLAVLAVARRS